MRIKSKISKKPGEAAAVHRFFSALFIMPSCVERYGGEAALRRRKSYEVSSALNIWALLKVLATAAWKHA